jgi:mannose-1-phosphate guanylyltransferase
MKALLIAGGFGTRLRPLTYTRPKHLLPIANRPHLHHVFDLLQRSGIDEVVLLTSYLAETFEASVAHGRERGMRVGVTHEEHPLGTAGALKNAQDFIGDETFFAFNGDVLTDTDLQSMLAFHRDSEAEATILLTPVDDPSAYGVVPTDGSGRVQGFIEKPPPGEAPTNLINAGVYIMEPSVLDRIPEGVEYSAERALFPDLVAEGARLFATGTDAYWMDIGTPAKYLQANMDALTGAFRTDAVGDPSDEAVVVAEGVSVAEGCKLAAACLGHGARVETGASIERSVLLADAVVERGARVVNSILGKGARIEAGVSVEGETLADETRVGG